MRITDRNSKYYGVETTFEDRQDFFSNLMGDRLRYMQILLNFLSNAIKFTDQGQTITIRTVLLEIQEIGDDKSASERGSLCKNNDKFTIREEQDDESTISYVKFAIEIEDSGVGISPEGLKEIFIDFKKLNEHSKINPNGTGIGLSICKLIVEKMRGEIDVKSEKDVGTTFSVIIRSKMMMREEPRFVRKFKVHSN